MNQRSTPLRVVVADDDDAFRAAVCEVLEADPRFVLAAQTASGLDLESTVKEAEADVVIVDVRMPGGGPDAVRAALSAGLAAPPAVVALSAQVNLATVVAMVGAGATGYLAKGRVGLTLPDLVARCAAGEVVLAVSYGADALRQLTS